MYTPLKRLSKTKSVTLFFVFVVFATTLLSPLTTQAASTSSMLIPLTAPKRQIARLIIPRIKVNAVIRDMGNTTAGAMAVPANNVEVGLYSIGPRPGEIGSAVIGGHNRWAKAPGVFVNLNKLKIGDKITVVDAWGVSSTFQVREMLTFNPTDDAIAIFNSDSGEHLNLITCAGVWNPKTQDYTKRLVIFTNLIHTPILT